MKKFMKALSLILIVAMCVSMFAACGDKKPTENQSKPTDPQVTGPTTAAELLDLSAGVMANVKNCNIGVKFGLDFKIDTELEGLKMLITFPMKLNANFDFADKYAHGTMDMKGTMKTLIEFAGESQPNEETIDESAEMYYVLSDDGKTAKVYTKDIAEDEWVVEEQDVEKLVSDLLAAKDDEELFKSAEMKKDGENYIITMKLADILKSDIMSDAMVNKGDVGEDLELDMDPADIADAVGDTVLTYTFNKDYYLVGLSTGDVKLDFSKLQTSDDEESTSALGLNPEDMDVSMNISVTIGKFGEIKEADVKVPENVKNSADQEKPEIDIPGAPIVDNGKVSDEWTDMDIMIDGVVYKFPYDYDALQENGWSFDVAEYGYEDGYILNKGDQTYSTFELYNEKYGYDYDSFSIYCGFQNFGKKPVDITECDLWSIELDIMDGFDPLAKHPSVVIANGITFGSTEEDVLNAFGECDDIYSSKEFGYKTYEYNYGYDKFLTITIFDEYGVTAIEFQSYGD